MTGRTFKAILFLGTIFFSLALLVYLISHKEPECHVWAPKDQNAKFEALKPILEDPVPKEMNDHTECAYELYYLILEEGAG